VAKAVAERADEGPQGESIAKPASELHEVIEAAPGVGFALVQRPTARGVRERNSRPSARTRA
jgi:hypothetical protein